VFQFHLFSVVLEQIVLVLKFHDSALELFDVLIEGDDLLLFFLENGFELSDFRHPAFFGVQVRAFLLLKGLVQNLQILLHFGYLAAALHHPRFVLGDQLLLMTALGF
jgi:hypothetical protein